MSSGIYKIVHSASGRIYIGSAVDLKRRWSDHIKGLRGNYHDNQRLQNSWNKHGEEAFKFEIVEECDRSILIEREQFWIDTLNPYYNIARIAGSTLGKTHTDEAKNKMRLANLGRKHSPESVERMRQSQIGRKHSDETKEKQSQSALGIKKNPEAVMKMSISKLGQGAKAYLITKPNGEIVMVVNLKQFCEQNNLDAPTMHRVASGKISLHKGYKCQRVS